MNESLGFAHFLAHADGVALAVLSMMLLASTGTWYLILTKGLHLHRMGRRSRAFLAAFWEAPNLEAVARRVQADGAPEPFSHLLHHGFSAIDQYSRRGPSAATLIDAGAPDEMLTRALKRAIDEDLLPGPRIYPSGAVITVTSGHGDFRLLSDLPRTIGMLSRIEQLGGSMVADSPDEVRLRVREQLMQGASQIKLTAGGGVASPFSPLDVSTFTEAELRAAVEAAENWGTYVCTHAYTPASIQRSIAAGVKCIEHGHLMDDATARLLAEGHLAQHAAISRRVARRIARSQ